MAALAGNSRFTDGDNVIICRYIVLYSAVEILVLEEDNGIIVADSRFDQPFRIVSAGRADDFQAGHMDKPHFRILRVKWAAMNVSAARAPNHERRGRTPTIVRLGHHIDNLIEGTADEVHELELCHRTHAGE